MKLLLAEKPTVGSAVAKHLIANFLFSMLSSLIRIIYPLIGFMPLKSRKSKFAKLNFARKSKLKALLCTYQKICYCFMLLRWMIYPKIKCKILKKGTKLHSKILKKSTKSRFKTLKKCTNPKFKTLKKCI